LRLILLSGLVIRLVAVVFSKGFGWIDDQFLVVEIAQSWVDGVDYYKWLPATEGNNGPLGFSFLYPGLHYLLFHMLEFIGINDPQGKMYIVRLMHALWSMLVIKYGYEITLYFSDRKTANLAGWLLALFWIFPFLSVRNMVEFVCLPLILKGTLMIVRSKGPRILYWLWIGLLFGLAFSIRYQTALITGGIGLVLLFEKRWLQSVYLTLGFSLAVILVQGVVDYIIWEEPFVQLIGYVTYNATSAGLYTVGPWYHYLLFLLGAMIPPVSLFLFAGFFKSYKKLLIIFIPTLIFLLFHSFYPNKQERFITTILPYLIISGVVGWKMIEDSISDRQTLRKWIRGAWVFFWIVNTTGLLAVSTMYSKKARVETMVYLSRYNDLEFFIIEDSNKDVLRFPPQFYLKKWLPYDAYMYDSKIVHFGMVGQNSEGEQPPGFVLFFMPDGLEDRIEKMKGLYPDLEYETTIEPGVMDQLLHWLNPVNANQNIYIYRNRSVIPEKRE
jgi:hypothetical protein